MSFFDTSSQKKVSLLEVLIIVAIVALIGFFAVVAVNSARSKQRDATRIANIRQLQSALEDYFNENNSYPSAQLLPLGDAAQSACLGMSGFRGDCSSEPSIFLRYVPGTYTDGLEGLVSCGEPARSAFCYSQRKDGDDYVIHFELENGLRVAGLQDGVNCAEPKGMKAGVCSE